MIIQLMIAIIMIALIAIAVIPQDTVEQKRYCAPELDHHQFLMSDTSGQPKYSIQCASVIRNTQVMTV